MPLLYHVIIAAAAIGFLEGSEIALFTLAAASRYKWRKAWMVTLAGLATLIPMLVIFYFFFEVIPIRIATLVAGAIIFLLGAHFFYEGYGARHEHEDAKEEIKEKLSAGLMGIYTAIVLEGAEASGISMSIGVAAGGAYTSAILGMAIGILAPLAAMKAVQPLLEKLPEWLVQITVGIVMMVAAALIIVYQV